MRVFVYKNEENRVVVSTIIDENLDPFKEINPNGFYATPEDVPEDANYWFECLEIIDRKIQTNLEKARTHTANRLRREREPVLQKLDVAFQRALENGENPKEVVKQKRLLRDLPLKVNTVSTLQELKDLSPTL
jgi:hypothetical protein